LKRRRFDLRIRPGFAAGATGQMMAAVGGTGGVVGPRLDGIAVRKDAAYIRESVMDPNAKLADGYTQLGISPMPPMSLILKAQEIEDVVAYLLTLRTPAR